MCVLSEDDVPLEYLSEWVIVKAPSSTITAIGSIRLALDRMNSILENLEPVLSENPSLGEFVTPTIDMVRETRAVASKNFKELLSTKKSELDKYESTIRTYEKMINSKDVDEKTIQKFLEENPYIINQGMKAITPKISFGGEKFPDFVAVLYNGKHILIEIEKPADRLYSKKGDPTAKFSHAEQQIEEYLKWASENKEFLQKRGLPNMRPENTKGLLVIGMNKGMTPEEKEKLEMHNYSTRSTYETKTFDEILLENQQVIKNIREYVKE